MIRMEGRPIAKYSILDLLPEYHAKLEKRFWPKVEKTDGCWVWKASKYTNGYGAFSVTLVHGRMNMLRAHRISYELVKGRIPNGLTIDHLCRNRACVNPNNLEPVTMKENILRGEGLTAQEARRTHCPKGHLLEGDNLVPSKLKHGMRNCLICDREQGRLWMQAHKQKP